LLSLSQAPSNKDDESLSDKQNPLDIQKKQINKNPNFLKYLTIIKIKKPVEHKKCLPAQK